MRNTMQGSGFNSEEMEREFTCRSCSWEGELTGVTDDSQIMLYAVCPSCKDELTIDLAMEREQDKWDSDQDNYWED
jgi:Zn finger protein HypA/HybF involved in hydrogenase expression